MTTETKMMRWLFGICAAVSIGVMVFDPCVGLGLLVGVALMVPAAWFAASTESK